MYNPAMDPVKRFLEHLKVEKNLSPSTVRAYASDLKQFVEFLVSEEAQEYFAQETFEYPLVPGIDADPLLPPIDTIPTPDIDLSDLASVLDTATDLVAQAGLL